MGVVHFLNVKDGDCSIIQHTSGRVSMIDICSGNEAETPAAESVSIYSGLQGNWNQKAHPVNPVDYLGGLKISSLWRFILTHPDMDHMDGIKRLFEKIKVENFWDTDNNKKMEDGSFGQYNRDDWDYYQDRRKSALKLHDGCKAKYYNADDDTGTGEGDFLQILCPTKKLVEEANEKEDYNNCSYVILYNELGRKILFCGDAEEKEWDVLLDEHEDDLADIDILIAPHHGRKSGGNDDFLDILNPKLTLFGNAKSKDLNYQDWNNRGLQHFTNNQGGTFVLAHSGGNIDVYCTNKDFALNYTRGRSWHEEKYKAWYLETV